MNQNLDQQPIEKRKKISLSKEEKDILVSLLVKAAVPIVFIITTSLIVLFFGFQFLIKKTGFSNFGLSSASVLHSVSQFISTYLIIALVNIFLMILLSIVVLYLALHNIVLPILRITRTCKTCVETNSKTNISVRSSDKLFIPLVDMINKLMHRQ
ncbi:MAG: hypothetical protein LHV68_08305 [Elusimicrobia bacterium]|nr:hypothetical protein [Candidatus Liberimonas magnetica]